MEGTDEKRCRGCGVLKPLVDFYRDRAKADGRANRCKACKRSLAGTVAIAEKRCRTCGLVKLLDDFYRSPFNRDGVEGQCKHCRARDPEAYDWRLAHPVPQGSKRCGKCRQVLPLTAFHRAARNTRTPYSAWCKACMSAYHAAHYVPTGRQPMTRDERRIARCLQAASYARAHPDKVKMRKQRWYAANPDTVNRMKRREYEKNRSAYIARARQREIRVKGTPGVYTLHDIRLIYEAQRGLCAYCLVPLDGVFDVEHMIPLGCAGTSNWPWNLCLACENCNTRKRTKTAGQFFALLLREASRAAAGCS